MVRNRYRCDATSRGQGHRSARADDERGTRWDQGHQTVWLGEGVRESCVRAAQQGNRGPPPRGGDQVSKFGSCVRPANAGLSGVVFVLPSAGARAHCPEGVRLLGTIQRHVPRHRESTETALSLWVDHPHDTLLCLAVVEYVAHERGKAR